MLLRRLALAGAALAWLLLLHMILLVGAEPVIRTARIALPGWPAAAPDIRIAFLSDLHPSTPGDTPATLRRTAARIAALKPDLVLIGGDMVADVAFARSATIDEGLDPLAALHPPLGSFAVLGNHDNRDPHRAAHLVAALRRLGIVPLANEAVRRGPLAILGIADRASARADVPLTLARSHAVGGVPVAFTHSPDVAPLLPDTVGLLLAGHTHCGQVRLPLIGAPDTQSIYGQRYVCGLIRNGAHTVIVSAGLGISNLPLRLGAPPDAWLVTVGH